jgi:hypothetical protein
MSYETDIIKALSKMGKNGTENPDAKSNTGRLLGEAFLWDRIEAYARNRSEAAWAALEKEGIVEDTAKLTPGDHQLAQSPSFAVFAKVTNPVKRFSQGELATLLAKSKYKVPISTTKEMCDLAKVPTKPMVSLKVVERT